MQARMQAVMRPFFIINTNSLFLFVICPIKKIKKKYLIFFDRFLKYLFYINDRWSNKLSTVCFHSIQFV